MTLSLLDLPPDLLNGIAYHLPPTSRLNLALCNTRLHTAVWSTHAAPDLIRRHPLERRLSIPLITHLTETYHPTSVPTPLRTVPARARQHHLNVALSPDASLVALLPYDNILRLIHTRRNLVCATHRVPAFANDVWDVRHAHRIPLPRPDAVVYAHDAGLDVETALQFFPDSSVLMVAARDALRFFRIHSHHQGPHNPTLTLSHTIPLSQALNAVGVPHDTTKATGGAAALSPDASHLAWVVFLGSPAVVHLTVWARPTDQQENEHQQQWRCIRTQQVHSVWTRRWTALAWARPIFTPNGQHLVVVVNSAHKVTRVVNVRGEFQRTKLCRFELMRMPVHGTYDEVKGSVVRKTEWLDLAADVYPLRLADAISGVLDGEVIHGCGMPFRTDVGTDDLDTTRHGQGGLREWTAVKLMRQPGLAFNSVHSCPAEATYKALTFGKAGHPWFVSKQPMFSFHFAPTGGRVVVATSPHSNVVQTLVSRRRDVDLGDGGRGEDWRLEEERVSGRRRHAFKSMPWRMAFAAVTAFSSSGQWLVGASLLDNDRCIVCVRNVTLREYFGDCPV